MLLHEFIEHIFSWLISQLPDKKDVLGDLSMLLPGLILVIPQFHITRELIPGAHHGAHLIPFFIIHLSQNAGELLEYDSPQSMIEDTLKYTLPEIVRGTREDTLSFIANLIDRGKTGKKRTCLRPVSSLML